MTLRPKLWDGPNPVGEAKERHLQTLDAPYLTSSGEGFVVRKSGPFSSITGVVETPSEVLDGWFSASNPAIDPVYVAGTSDYQQNFRRRATLPTAGEDFTEITALLPDGRGRGTFPLFKEETIAGRVRRFAYALMSISGRTFKELFQYDVLISGMAVQVAGVGTTAARLGQSSSPGKRMSGNFDTLFYTDDRGATRHRARVRLFAETSGVWEELPVSDFPAIAYEDSNCPWGVWLTPTRLVVVFAHRPMDLWMLHYSDDFGATWSAGVSLVGAFPGITLVGSAPFSEEYLHDTYSLIWNVARTTYLGQTEVKYRLIATSRDSAGFATSASSFVISTGAYWDGTAWVLAVSNIHLSGAILSVRTFPAPGPSDLHKRSSNAVVLVLGRGAWLVDVQEYDLFSETYTSSARWVTWNNGDTYNPLAIAEGPLLVQTWHVLRPSSGDPARLVVLAPGTDETGARVLLKTADLVTFKKVSRIASPGDVRSEKDFNRVLHVGTPEGPGPITPHAPWSSSTNYPAPAWWTE